MDLPTSKIDENSKISEKLGKLYNPEVMLTLREIKRISVLTRIDYHGGNKTKAAKSLGVPRSTLYKWLRRWQCSKIKSRGQS